MVKEWPEETWIVSYSDEDGNRLSYPVTLVGPPVLKFCR